MRVASTPDFDPLLDPALLRDDGTGRWWAFAARGLAGLLFGAACLLAPGNALALFVPLFATLALVDGGFALAAAHPRWWASFLIGGLGIAAMLFTLLVRVLEPGGASGAGGVALVTAFAAWATATGLLEILLSAQLRRSIDDEYLLTLTGLFGFGVGVGALFTTASGAGGLLGWVAAWTILAGAARVAVALRIAARSRAPLVTDAVAPLT